MKRHVEGFALYDQATRRVVLLRLANELEDHLERSAAYASADLARRRQERRDAWLVLARAAGSPAFVRELSEAFDRQLDPPLLLAVVIGAGPGLYATPQTLAGTVPAARNERCLVRWMRARSR